MKKKQLFFILILLSSHLVSNDSITHLKYFTLDNVKLLDSPFKHAQDVNKKYLLALDADRLLSPFYREAKLTPMATSYTNWENTGLDGHMGGHYLSALSYMYASTGDAQIKQRLDYMISALKNIQDANGNGYIGGVPDSKNMWEQIANGNVQSTPFMLNGKWVPLYNIHKTFAGLRDAWVHTQNTTAKEMLIKMSDWMYNIASNLSDEQIQDMLRSEHGGLNEIFADVAAITNNEKYLDLAQRFSQKEFLDPLLSNNDQLTGMHANTQIPKVIGFERIAELNDENRWSDAAQFFWTTVVKNRSVCIGGNSNHEHFNPVDDFLRMVSTEQGPETCNTYNMLKLTMMLNSQKVNSKYIDYYERALYNHILSTQNPNTGGLVYFTPMRPAHYRVYSQPQTSMWCCVGSGIENHSKYGEMIYAHKNKELYVNLFIPSRLYWKDEGVEIVQTNQFPSEDKTRLIVNTSTAKKFNLKVRYPIWTQKLLIKVNGKQQKAIRDKQGFVSIHRSWKNGDEIVIQMPMHLKAESFPDRSNFRALIYGPIVLASKSGTTDMPGLFADDSRGGHIAHGSTVSFSEIPIVASDNAKLISSIAPIKDKPLHFTMKTSAETVELEPFYAIHESRYTIYWPTSPIANTADALLAATVDVVYCGQQQPESDHLIEFENNETGYSNHTHWRQAVDWFSYQLNNEKKQGRFLQISYLDTKQKTQFSVLVDNSVAKTITSENGDGRKLSTLIHIPATLLSDKFGVTIKGANGFASAPIIEIRVLKNAIIGH